MPRRQTMVAGLKYTHQDVVRFVQEDIVPEALACSIGFGLMRQPVRINGDPTDHPYDASIAKRALETKRKQSVHPEVPSMPSQPCCRTCCCKRMSTCFVRRCWAYTKVAAYLAETEQCLPSGEIPHLRPTWHRVKSWWLRPCATLSFGASRITLWPNPCVRRPRRPRPPAMPPTNFDGSPSTP